MRGIHNFWHVPYIVDVDVSNVSIRGRMAKIIRASPVVSLDGPVSLVPISLQHVAVTPGDIQNMQTDQGVIDLPELNNAY